MEYAFAAKDALKVNVNTSIFDAILEASLVVKLTLLLLIGLSVVSWAIIFAKNKQFSHQIKVNMGFLDLFWKANSLDEVYTKVDNFKDCALANVFRAGFIELQRIADSGMSKKNADKSSPQLIGLDNLSRALRKSSDIEIALLESKLNFLATTGSTAPFIGLFGTVWGIMGSFHNIGATGSASLAVVAPGISEALFTTAIGLLAAIPAVVGYNTFLSKVKKQELEISNFNSDFLNMAKRNFFKDE